MSIAELRPTRQELMERIKTEKLTVLDAYEGALDADFGLRTGSCYLSASITSGLFGRVISLLSDPAEIQKMLPIVMDLNGRFATNIVRQLEIEGQLSEYSRILPHLFQGGKDWTQFDYNCFWSLCLSGMEVSDAKNFLGKAEAKVDKSILNDHAKNRSERRVEYDVLLDVFANHVSQLDLDGKKIGLMVCFPDSQVSLGCSLECAATEVLGVPVKEVVFDATQPDQLAELFNLKVLNKVLNRFEMAGVQLPMFEGDGKDLILLRDVA